MLAVIWWLIKAVLGVTLARPDYDSYESWWRRITHSPRLAEVAGGRNNNFNLIRFVAASLVIMFHGFAVAPTPGAVEPVYWLTRGRDDGGSISVLVFFIISGFLVTKSFVDHGRRLAAFLGARLLRIFPALWVAVPFTIIVSSFASPVPWGAYLTHPQTLKYWLHNSFLWDLQFSLPGAFLHNPLARNVNGSLWTLPTEFRMYLMCAGLGLLGLYFSRSVFNAFLLTFLSVAWMTRVEALPLAYGSLSAAQWMIAFLAGMFFYINRDEIRLSVPVALLLLGSTYFIRNPEMGRIYILPALAYATFCFSLHPALFVRPFTRIGDYSYGLYVYAFPLQQQMVFYHPGINWLKGLALSYPIILGVAVLSWHFVEKPALSLKRFLEPRKQSSSQTQQILAVAVDGLR